jgi:hypothetical protein
LWRRSVKRSIELAQLRLRAAMMRRNPRLTGGSRTVPVMVEEGNPPQIGWMGRSRII